MTFDRHYIESEESQSQHAQRIDNLYSFFGETQESPTEAPVDITWFRQEIADERHLLLIEQQHSQDTPA